MMAQKGMLPPDPADKPWKNGLVTFAAFIVFGSAPLLSFIILIPFTDNESVKFLGACLLSALALAILGVAKAKIAGQNYAFSAAMTLFNGAIAAAAAYVLGWTLRNIAGLDT
ncbi:Ccc1 family [Trema orientale]|uniref:Vacuolar iron transporter n=1 Tax=Trema orientale TaxID=63057 RepID=A0A2P5EI38_TREOI|nr:Ccc1 family [Trema orientale]